MVIITLDLCSAFQDNQTTSNLKPLFIHTAGGRAAATAALELTARSSQSAPSGTFDHHPASSHIRTRKCWLSVLLKGRLVGAGFDPPTCGYFVIAALPLEILYS